MGPYDLPLSTALLVEIGVPIGLAGHVPSLNYDLKRRPIAENRNLTILSNHDLFRLPKAVVDMPCVDTAEVLLPRQDSAQRID